MEGNRWIQLANGHAFDRSDKGRRQRGLFQSLRLDNDRSIKSAWFPRSPYGQLSSYSGLLYESLLLYPPLCNPYRSCAIILDTIEREVFTLTLWTTLFSFYIHLIELIVIFLIYDVYYKYNLYDNFLDPNKFCSSKTSLYDPRFFEFTPLHPSQPIQITTIIILLLL